MSLRRAVLYFGVVSQATSRRGWPIVLARQFLGNFFFGERAGFLKSSAQSKPATMSFRGAPRGRGTGANFGGGGGRGGGFGGFGGRGGKSTNCATTA